MDMFFFSITALSFVLCKLKKTRIRLVSMLQQLSFMPSIQILNPWIQQRCVSKGVYEMVVIIAHDNIMAWKLFRISDPLWLKKGNNPEHNFCYHFL